VSISNNDLQLLTFVLGCLGAGKITRKRTYQPQHAPAFAFQFSGRQALALLMCIAPYLRSYKAKRAQLALESYLAVTPRNGKYTPDAHGPIGFRAAVLCDAPLIPPVRFPPPHQCCGFDIISRTTRDCRCRMLKEMSHGPRAFQVLHRCLQRLCPCLRPLRFGLP
jgi:hypothetical protein